MATWSTACIVIHHSKHSVPALFHAGRCLEMVVAPPKESYQISTTKIQQHGK